MRSIRPSRLSSATFAAKAHILQAARYVSDLRQPVRRLGHASPREYRELLAECRTPLWTAESLVENSLQFGKIQNLRKACRRLHCVTIPAGETFSFWKQLGKAKASAGYVVGRELRQGCLIPSLGGGLCQLSNSLYELALCTGCEIVERHAHTAVVPGSAAEQGRDATVFWNYVDLRFRPRQSILITTVLTKQELIVRFWGAKALFLISAPKTTARSASVTNTCTDCGVAECFRHIPAHSSALSGNNAFVIEECWPEFERYVEAIRSDNDDLFLPYHSNLRRIPRYTWNSRGYRRIVSANSLIITAALFKKLRLNDTSPPVAAQLKRSEQLASYYSLRLAIHSTRIYVAQSLLPFFWRNGDLGGRNFSVLMTRLPLRELHQELDSLVARYPDRRSFQEFRAPQWMVQAETEALECAEQIITPHVCLAALFRSKAALLPWKLPEARRLRGSHIIFPGPALARKGAFELRTALRGLPYRLRVLHSTAESHDFWHGVPLSTSSNDWLEDAAVVVQPAFLENNPRPLLRALAAGIPVIATPECGIPEHPLLTLVPAGDADGLREKLQILAHELPESGVTRRDN